MTEPEAPAAPEVAAAAQPPTMLAPVPATRAAGRRPDWLVDQLPTGMLAEDFFVRFVRIFQEQSETLLAHADNLPHLADPRVAPPEMIRYLAQWLGSPGIDDSYPETTQRAVLRTVARTLGWRGTRVALLALARLYSGGSARLTDGGGVFAPGEVPEQVAWVRLEVESTGPLSEQDFLTLILDEVPAHVHAEVIVAGEQVWPQRRTPSPRTDATSIRQPEEPVAERRSVTQRLLDEPPPEQPWPDEGRPDGHASDEQGQV